MILTIISQKKKGFFPAVNEPDIFICTIFSNIITSPWNRYWYWWPSDDRCTSGSTNLLELFHLVFNLRRLYYLWIIPSTPHTTREQYSSPYWALHRIGFYRSDCIRSRRAIWGKWLDPDWDFHLDFHIASVCNFLSDRGSITANEKWGLFCSGTD